MHKYVCTFSILLLTACAGEIPRDAPTWVYSAEEKELTPEISFTLQDELSISDMNPSAHKAEQMDTVPISLSAFTLEDGRHLRSRFAVGKEAELAQYYSFVVDQLTKHHPSALQVDLAERHAQYFWLDLSLIDEKGDEVINFAWRDSIRDFQDFFDAIKSDNTGYIFADSGQGWGIVIHSYSDYFYIAEGEDQKNPHTVVKVRKEGFRASALETYKRATSLIAELKNRTGFDYWSVVPGEEKSNYHQF